MTQMIKIFKETKIFVLTENEMQISPHPSDLIQVELLGNLYIAEVISDIGSQNLTPYQAASAPAQTSALDDIQAKILEYKATILNNDPFMEFDGFSLGEIMESPDWPKWSARVVREMKNKFIKERVEFLLEHAR